MLSIISIIRGIFKMEPKKTEIENKTETNTEPSDWVLGEQCTPKTSPNNSLFLGDMEGAVKQIPFLAKQPDRGTHRSDWISDIAQIGELTVMATSMRGSSHYAFNNVRQDAYAIGNGGGSDGDEWLITAIADGVSASPLSHGLADYMVRQTILTVEDALRANDIRFERNYWEKINLKLIELSIEYCRRKIKPSQKDTYPLESLAGKWATTLEYAVIQTKKTSDSQTRKFVYVSVAGDSSAYILNKKKGWKVIKHGKQDYDKIDKNVVVTPLPLTPATSETFLICNGELPSDDYFIMVTDGLGDQIRFGDTPFGGFFQQSVQRCTNLSEFLKCASIAGSQADDDRTIILVRQGI